MIGKKRIVVLTGAGISAESGISTFRDANGLWENHNIYDVATPEGFQKNPVLVHHFYNQRRKQLLDCHPNNGHLALKELEKWFHVDIITQNVDDLHERAGSTHILHLHGELRKVRSVQNPHIILDWNKDLSLEDKGPDGQSLRPHIVWFGEDVPNISKAIDITKKADILIVIGTSLQVYPAAGLVEFVDIDVPKFYIDPNAHEAKNFYSFETIAKNATEGVPYLVKKLINEFTR